MPEYYTPDTRQRLAKASRFFARVESFTLECPACGQVYIIRQDVHQGRGKVRRASLIYDPITSRFRCTKANCRKVYIIGLLAWPITAAPRVATAQPMDQTPSTRQLAQLRKEGGGWWMADEEAQRYPKPHVTNLTTEEERPDDEDED